MDKAKKLRDMLNSVETIVSTGAYDCISARIAQDVGFQCLGISGVALVASMLGKPDISLATMTEITARARQIASSVDIPVICDADAGYGNLNMIRRTVEEFEASGISGIHIEDQITEKKCSELGSLKLVSCEEHYERIRIACRSRKNSNFVIIARTDARKVYDLEETIHRCKEYVKAGADMVFPEGLTSLDEIKTVCKKVNAPVMYLLFQGAPEKCYHIEELKNAGVKLIINGLNTELCVFQKLKEINQNFYNTGSMQMYYKDMMKLDELYRIVGIEKEANIKEWL